MNSNVEIISKETIKPSSPTPDHLKIFKLSCFDQFAPPIYVPFLFFYKQDESITSNHATISQNLKKSLSETLTTFYPLAGRIHGVYAVNCNDAGVEFTETRVRSQLTESIQERNVEQLKKLLPLDPAVAGSPGERTLLLVQLNFFNCGGVSVGICISHRIADMASMMMFITAWAAAASGSSGPCRTRKLGFELGRYFPAREHPSSFDLWEAQKPNANLESGMLVFTKEKLASLKRAATASTESTVADPTRVELVSSFVWNTVSKFLKTHPERGQFGAMLSVNVRARVSPTQKILENVFGNFIAPACVFPSDEDAVEEFHESVMKFRTSIRSISGEIPSDAESQEQMVEGALSILGDMKELYPITSWCRYPIYEVDFGWGKPVLFCSPRSGIKNGVLFLDARNGEDVELWLLNVDPEILDILEKEFKLIR